MKAAARRCLGRRLRILLVDALQRERQVGLADRLAVDRGDDLVRIGCGGSGRRGGFGRRLLGRLCSAGSLLRGRRSRQGCHEAEGSANLASGARRERKWTWNSPIGEFEAP